MDIRAELVTRKSKSGKEYKCIVIHITDEYEKLVFLDKAEMLLLESEN